MWWQEIYDKWMDDLEKRRKKKTYDDDEYYYNEGYSQAIEDFMEDFLNMKED